MTVSPALYERLALEDPDAKWELVCGRLRQKPSMTHAHNFSEMEIAFQLRLQLSPAEFEVRCDAGRVRTVSSYFIPDVFVIPAGLTSPFRNRDNVLEAYAQPLPLVVEVWSRSTADYDVSEKLDEYRRRGDAEIWLVHPFERTITAWRRGANGSYSELVVRDGTIRPVALPGVVVELGALFGP